jgi:hypothetical protein
VGWGHNINEGELFLKINMPKYICDVDSADSKR